MASIEEKVEDYYKSLLDELGIRRFSKTEKINDSITNAFEQADSKSGGSGMNYPDIQLLLENNNRRNIPVMIEVKGGKNKLEKLTPDGNIEMVSSGKDKNRAVQQYAVNGALHYGLAILKEGTYGEVIIIGVNGFRLENGVVKDPEIKAYYVSKKNNEVPKEISEFDFVQMRQVNIDKFYSELDTLSLTEAEREKLKRDREELLEQKIKEIHQKIYDDANLKTLLTTNEKLYLFCGLIMAGLTTDGVKSLKVSKFDSNDDEDNNDGHLVLMRTKSFLKKKSSSEEKINMVMHYLTPVFNKRALWKPVKDESVIKTIYRQVKKDILPILESNIHLDFTGKILNSLNDWVSIDNDKENDVVLTPRFVTNLMARISRTNKDSFVWDTCMGSSGFLVSAMEIMIDDATRKIKDQEVLAEKINNIKQNQLLGIEILGNIYILAVLNMILMGDGSSNIICGDSHKEVPKFIEKNSAVFPANVFLLNPPYSAPGKGLVFVEEALSRMESGYAAILIQENAGSGQGDGYSQKILQKNTLIASIHMPGDLFIGRANVQAAIYLFEVNRPHEEDCEVIFIDFSKDGYLRQNRSKSTQKVNLRNVDYALERYEEVAAICLGKKPKTSFYTKENGLLIRDTISLRGDDWAYSQHKKVDLVPTKEDFKKTVTDYLVWKMGNVLSEKIGDDVNGAD